MAANQQAAPKQPKEPKVQVQKQVTQEQPQEQLQAAQNLNQKPVEQPQEQLKVAQEQAQATQEQPQEQLKVAQEQSNEQLEVAQEQPQLTLEQLQAAQEHINPLKATDVRKGIKEFHDEMMFESKQRAEAFLKAKEESDDSNVVTRRK